jgi:carboxyl-terminal processing protease
MKFLAMGVASALALSIVQPHDALAQNAAQSEAPLFNAEAAWTEFEQVMRGAYAYIDRDDIDVEAQLVRSKQIALATTDAAAFRKVIHQTALTFMDPHLIVGPFTDDDYAIVMTAADMDARFVDGDLRVSDVRAGSPAFDAGIRSGDRVTMIDGAQPALAARLPFGDVLPDPTAAQLDYGATLAINGRREGSRNLVIDNGNGAREIELITATQYARSFGDRPLVSTSRIGEEGAIGVIRIGNSLGNNDTITAFDAAMAEMADARAIVLDMRDTPSGGNTEVARSIIGHFTDQAMPYQMHRIPAIEREFSVPRQFVEYVQPRAPYFSGPVYVLHGRWTGSMGEGIVIGMDAATDAVSIGSNMGDLLGGLWNIDLNASGARIDLGGESLFHVDGTPREDFAADVEISPAETAADGSDPAMAAVLQLLHQRD